MLTHDVQDHWQHTVRVRSTLSVPTTLIFDTGIPRYRTHILYVPQRPSLLPGTPRDFLTSIGSLKSRKSRASLDFQPPVDVAKGWGIDAELWDREWSSLSGGES